MHKILVLSEHQHPVYVAEDTLTVRWEEALKVLPALRDSHFVQCKVVLAKKFDPVECRFFINVPRVLKPEGRLVLDCKELTPECKEKVKELIDDLGLHIHAHSQSGYVIGKTRPETSQPEPEKLAIGFHQQSAKQPVKIDQDELLKNDILEKKAKLEPCITKPKACANCNCGRKQAEYLFGQDRTKSKDELVKEVNQGVVKSNCGNCYLGDAFRCASCPYKGLPAFKPGEKVSLNLTQEVAAQAQTGGAQLKEGKVKLDL